MTELLIKPRQIISRQTQRRGVIGRICDTGGNGHQQIYPQLLAASPPRLPSRIKSFPRGNFLMFLSVIPQIKGKKRGIRTRHQSITITNLKKPLPLPAFVSAADSCYGEAKRLTTRLDDTFDLSYGCFYFWRLSLCTSETGQMAGLLSDNTRGDKSAAVPRDSLAPAQLQRRLESARNSSIMPGFPPVTSRSVVLEPHVSKMKLVSYVGHSHRRCPAVIGFLSRI